MDILDTITELSHEFGTTDYVRGGGGNTSCKNEATLWVKPSGTTLKGMTKDAFVPLDRAKITELYSISPPEDAAAREAWVKDIMMRAVLPDATGRPSVEAPLHDSFDATYVIHTHPARVGGMVASRDGETVCARLFPQALWLGYTDPGYTLSIACREAMRLYAEERGRQPDLVFLQNHGVFVAANSADEARNAYRCVMDTLTREYIAAGISTALDVGDTPDAACVANVARRLRDAMGEQAAHVGASGPYPVADGPISPDHICYARSYHYLGEPERDTLLAFRETNNYFPRVIATESGVFGVGVSEKVAARALEFSQDGALVKQLAEAFGGIRYVDDRARDFIENWEVEAYRSKVAGG